MSCFLLVNILIKFKNTYNLYLKLSKAKVHLYHNLTGRRPGWPDQL